MAKQGFISDNEMEQLEKSQNFISDEEMSKLESETIKPEKTTGQKVESNVLGVLGSLARNWMPYKQIGGATLTVMDMIEKGVTPTSENMSTIKEMYNKNKEDVKQQYDQIREDAPIAHGATTVASTLLMPGKKAATSAAMGLYLGSKDAENYKELIRDGAIGLATGGIGGKIASSTAAKNIEQQGIKNISKAFQPKTKAVEQIIKNAGGEHNISEYMLKQSLLTPVASSQKVLKNVEEATNYVGKQIESYVGLADKSGVKVDLMDVYNEIDDKVIKKLRDEAAMIGDKELDSVANKLDEMFTAQLHDPIVPASKAMDMRRLIDDNLKRRNVWTKNPADLTPFEKELLNARGVLADSIYDSIEKNADEISKAGGSAFKQLRSEYQKLKAAGALVAEKLKKDNRKPLISNYDIFATIAGATTGGPVGGAIGGVGVGLGKRLGKQALGATQYSYGTSAPGKAISGFIGAGQKMPVLANQLMPDQAITPNQEDLQQ